MNTLRWWLAITLWRLQGRGYGYNVLYHLCRWPYYGGRHLDWEPVCCDECGWRGPRRWTWHTYRDGGDGDAEPDDECPHCGMSV